MSTGKPVDVEQCSTCQKIKWQGLWNIKPVNLPNWIRIKYSRCPECDIWWQKSKRRWFGEDDPLKGGK